MSSTSISHKDLRVFNTISIACSALLALSIAFQLRAEFSVNRRLKPILNGRLAGAVFFLCTIVQAVFLEVNRAGLPVAWDRFGGGGSGNRTSTSCNAASFDRASVHILTMLAPTPFLFAPGVWERVIPPSAAMCGLLGLVILAKDGLQRPGRLTLRLSVVVGAVAVFHHVVIAVTLSRQHVLFVILGVLTAETLGMTLSAVSNIMYAASLSDQAFFPRGRWRRLAAGMPAYPRLFALSHLLGMAWVVVAVGVAVLPAWSGDWAAAGFSPLGCVLLAMVILEIYTQAVSETQVLVVSQSTRTHRTIHKDSIMGEKMSLRKTTEVHPLNRQIGKDVSNNDLSISEPHPSEHVIASDISFVDEASNDTEAAFHCHLLNDSSLQPITPLLLFFSFLLFALTAVYARTASESALNTDDVFEGEWKHFPYLYAWLCLGVAGSLLPRYAALQLCFSRGHACAPSLQMPHSPHSHSQGLGRQAVDTVLAIAGIGNVGVAGSKQDIQSAFLQGHGEDSVRRSQKLQQIKQTLQKYIQKASSWKGQQIIAATNFTLSAAFFVYLISSGHVANTPNETSNDALSNCAPLECGKCFSTGAVSSGKIGCGWCATAGGGGVCLNGKQLSSGLQIPVASSNSGSDVPDCLTFNLTAASKHGWCESVSCESMQSCQNCSSRADCGWCSNGRATGCHQIESLKGICPGAEVVNVQECGQTFCSERESLDVCVQGPSPVGDCGWCPIFKQCRLASYANPYMSIDGQCQMQLSNWQIATQHLLPRWNIPYDGSDPQSFSFFQDPCWNVGDSCESCANQTLLLGGAYPCAWCPALKRCISSSVNTTSGKNITGAPEWSVQQTELCIALRTSDLAPALVGAHDSCIRLAAKDTEEHCSQHKACISCSSDSLCGWCGQEQGSCVAYGNSTSSLDGKCRDGPWWMPQVRACTAQQVGWSGCSQQQNCFECMQYGSIHCDWCEATASCKPRGTCDTTKPVIPGGSSEVCKNSPFNCSSLSGPLSCIDCSATSECWWVASTGVCDDKNFGIGGPDNCPAVQQSKCKDEDENGQGCAACLAKKGCGFCASFPDDSSGLCLDGDELGAFNSSCTYGRWSFGNPNVCDVNYFPYEVMKSSTPIWFDGQAPVEPFQEGVHLAGDQSAATQCSLKVSCSRCVNEGCQWCASRELGTGFGGYCSPRSSVYPGIESNCTWDLSTCPNVNGVSANCELCIQAAPESNDISIWTAVLSNASWLPIAEQKWGVIPNISASNYSQGHHSVLVNYQTEWCWSSKTCPSVQRAQSLGWIESVPCGQEELIPNDFSTVACQDPCFQQTSCDSCSTLPYCGWCQHSSGDARGGQCMMANQTDGWPLKSMCPAANWVKAGDLRRCRAFRSSVKSTASGLFATSCLEELTMAVAACCVAIVGLAGIGWTLLVQKHPSWKVGWLPADDLFRLGTLVKAYLAAVKALLLGQMITSRQHSSNRNSETIILLVLFLASFLAVFWITIVDVRQLWSTVQMWKNGSPFPITAKHPRLFVFAYGFLFLWVKVTLLLIGVGGHVSTKIVSTARFLVASASVGVVVNNEIAQRLRMAMIAANTDGAVASNSDFNAMTGSSADAALSSPARQGVSMKGVSSLVPVAIAIGTAACGYFGVAGVLLLNRDDQADVADATLSHIALALSVWEGIYVCGLVILLWSYYGAREIGSYDSISRTGKLNQ